MRAIENKVAYGRRNYLTNRTLYRFHRKEIIFLNRIKVLMFYSNPVGHPVCNNCGEQDMDVLCLDHINGGGNKERRETIKAKGSGSVYWIMRNKYPSGFQVLCFNCNMRKTRTETWRNRN